MPQRQGFVYGALLLALAAVVSKLLGSVYTIVLQNVIGDHGMGLFQMAYPVYATLLAVATAGFPVAISKLVSERVALGDEYGVRQIFRVASTLLCTLGILTFAVLYLWAERWAGIAGDPDAAWAIRAIAPALLMVPLVSAIRGYFQGYQWMQPTAVSQVVEQFVRVATILGLAIWIMQAGYGKEMAAAGAAFGAVTGAGAALVLLAYYWFAKHPHNAAFAPRKSSSRALAKQLIYYAFPISLGALVVPLMNNVDVMTVVNLLKGAGESQSAATTDFGLLSGRAFKLMMLPTTLASGIGIAVMPAVSEAFTLGFRRLMSERIDTAVRLTVLIALPASVGLAMLAAPIDITLFKDDTGSGVIQIMAFATLFASVQTTAAAVLQGAGWVYLPVVNLLLASVVKLIGNLVFVPQYGIQGAAVATVLSYGTATVLNFAALYQCLREKVRWKHWVVKPLIAAFIMGGFVYAMQAQWIRWGGMTWDRIGIGIASGIIILIAIVIYAVALLLTGALTERELGSVPRIGPRIVLWCRRIGWLRS